MKITNLMIHIFSALLLIIWAFVPAMMSFVEVLVSWVAGELNVEGLIAMLTGCMALVASLIILILGIISYCRRNKISDRKYTIFESIITGMTLLMFLIILPVTIFINGKGVSALIPEFSDLYTLLVIPPIIGILLSSIAVVMTIINAATSRRKAVLSH